MVVVEAIEADGRGLADDFGFDGRGRQGLREGAGGVYSRVADFLAVAQGPRLVGDALAGEVDDRRHAGEGGGREGFAVPFDLFAGKGEMVGADLAGDQTYVPAEFDEFDAEGLTDKSGTADEEESSSRSVVAQF